MIPSATDEVLRLRKDLRLKEADYSKEKALLLQKIEQLEHSLKDCKEREEAQKRMHDTMMNCLNSGGEPSATNQALIQLQAAEKQAQGLVEDLKIQKRRLQEELEYKDFKEKELRSQIADKESFAKELQTQVERVQNDKRQLCLQQEQERKDFQSKLSLASNEKDALVQKVELKCQQQVNELKVQIETMKLEHQREVEKLKAECEQSLKEIKYFHDQEKYNLQHRVERSTNELSSLIHLVKQRDAAQDLDETRHENILRKREELEAELKMLHDEVEQIKQHHDLAIASVTKEKVAVEAKALKLQKQLEKIKNAPKPVKIDLSSTLDKTNESDSRTITNLKNEIDSLVKENEKQDEQIKKLRKEKLENQDYIDSIELKVRQLQKERNMQDLDSDKCTDLKRQLNQERKKNIDLQENINILQDNMETLENNHNSKLLDKDQKLNKLYKDLRDTERKLTDIQSVFNSGPNLGMQKAHTRNISPFIIGTGDLSHIHTRNVSHSPLVNHNHTHSQQSYQHLSPRAQMQQQNQSQMICAPMQEGTMNMKQISQVEYTLLKICQRMADNAIRMECNTCMHMFETADFYDHVNSEHPQMNKTVIQNQSIVQYNTNKNLNQTKKYAEDMRSSSHMHNILQTSPKIKDQHNQSRHQHQQSTMHRWAHGSRSFTCLLNEIEEEEKVSNTSRVPTGSNTDKSHHTSKHMKQSKSPKYANNHEKSQSISNQLKSRNVSSNNPNNMSTLQLSTLGTGNTLQSVLRTQKESKKKTTNTSTINTSRVQNPQSVIINTAQRTEIQNLKRENKKLNSKLQEQEQKINDVSRDCSNIKKQVQNEKVQGPQSQLTNEIKGLLEKLVTYQANSKGEYCSEKTSISGAFTSRKYSNLPMSTESLVELKSNSSVMHKKKKKSGHQHKESKSPLPLNLNSTRGHDFSVKHQSNKENVKALGKQKSNQNLTNVPKLKLKAQSIMEDQHHSSSSNEIHDQSMITTERRYHQVKKSEQLVSNSPQRYQNYFEVLSSLTDTHQQDNSSTARMRYKQSRYSPSNDSQYSKLTSVKSQPRLNQPQNEPASSSKNQNMPMNYNSKQLQQQYTICSSQNNLVLYDSQHTDHFKSKNLMHKKEQPQYNIKNQQPHANGYKRLDFDQHQTYSQMDSCNDIDGLQNMPSSCPSLDEYEENQLVQGNDTNYGEGIFGSSLDSDPFITGRFCDNNGTGKHFQFKYSANNSKNSTMRTHNLINQ